MTRRAAGKEPIRDIAIPHGPARLERHMAGPRVNPIFRIVTTSTIALLAAAASLGSGIATAGETTTAPPPAPASQPPAAAVPPPSPPPSQGTPAIVLDTNEYEGLLGQGVTAVNGDDLGRIIDVIVDKDGKPRAAIIDFGGFLGVGSRKIAVDWRVLSFAVDGKPGHITLTLNRNQVRVSPEYKPGEPIVVLGTGSPGAPAPDAEAAAAAAAATAAQAPPPPVAKDKPAEPVPAEKPPEKSPQ